MNILIVEDDEFKLNALQRLVTDGRDDITIEICKSVKAAVKAVSERDHDLLVLDMSLPSHDLELAEGLGIPRLSGGIEVLFEVQYQAKKMPTIIVTQYPEIELENQMVPISEVRKYLIDAFEIEVDTCLFFDLEDMTWSEELRRVLAAR